VVLILQWIISGLDQRFHWSDSVPLAGVVAGLVIVAIGLALFTWSALVNPFFSSVTRMQEDRGQQVISAGPCLGYFPYLFQNLEGNHHAGNLITICLMHKWRRK